MKSGEKGFTLLELLVVMAILGLLSMAVMPQMLPVLDRIRLQSDARDVAQALRAARQQAISTGKPAAVYIYPYASLYRVQDGKNLPFREGVKCVDTSLAPAYSDGPPACTFHPSGVPLPRAGTVVLANQRGEKAYIIVNPVVGRVRVSNSPPSSWTD